jgi:hypothetical protein
MPARNFLLSQVLSVLFFLVIRDMKNVKMNLRNLGFLKIKVYFLDHYADKYFFDYKMLLKHGRSRLVLLKCL